MLNKKKGDGTNIGDRFKRYEEVSQSVLTRRIPVILRVDGNAFHTLTRRLWGRGYSDMFEGIMDHAASAICSKISGLKLIYIQGDEASFLLTDYDTIETQPWFDYNVNKLVSISAGMFTAFFNINLQSKMGCYIDKNISWFDSRAFNVPHDEVCNYFIWRQRDWERNSIGMFAGTVCSHKELEGKNCNERQEMMFKKGLNWDKLPVAKRRGRAIYRKDGEWFLDYNIPQFTRNRDFINQWVYLDKESEIKGTGNACACEKT